MTEGLSVGLYPVIAKNRSWCESNVGERADKGSGSFWDFWTILSCNIGAKDWWSESVSNITVERANCVVDNSKAVEFHIIDLLLKAGSRTLEIKDGLLKIIVGSEVEIATDLGDLNV